MRAREQVGDALLKLHRVAVETEVDATEERPRYGRPRGRITEATLAKAWAALIDAGHDRLAIPQKLRWSTLPRSREYMNMEAGYGHLWRAYQRALYRDDAATAATSEPEYGEPFMQWYRERCAEAAGQQNDDDEYDDEDDGEEYNCSDEDEDEW